jgi:hypothetical protein
VGGFPVFVRERVHRVVKEMVEKQSKREKKKEKKKGVGRKLNLFVKNWCQFRFPLINSLGQVGILCILVRFRNELFLNKKGQQKNQ